MKPVFCSGMSVLLLASGLAAQSAQETLVESARDIPVAYDVDVVVIGGTTGAAAAAVAASRQGASVFLAAPRPYLGEDVCATHRLWLEPGEEPKTDLEKALFAEPEAALLARNRLPFTYKTDLPSSDRHRDTSPPSLLSDGKWDNAYRHSVQYDGDVNVVADLGKEMSLSRVQVLFFQRPGDIELEGVSISISRDGQEWSAPVEVRNEQLGAGEAVDYALRLCTELKGAARYVKITARKTERVDRLLLGEIIIQSDEKNTAPEAAAVPVTPMQIKLNLDQALLDAGVPFLHGCFATDVLRDSEGNVAGIVMANRAGRQAVRAKVVIDATTRAFVARAAGASFSPYPKGRRAFRRVVVGGQQHQGEGITPHAAPTFDFGRGVGHAAIDYELLMEMKDDSIASFAEAEQAARDMTWDPGQLDASECLFEVPPDQIEAVKRLRGEWLGSGNADLDAFRPKGIDRLYVLGGCADVSRDAAARMLRPLELMRLGDRIGSAAALEARRTAKPDGIHVQAKPTDSPASGDVREGLVGIRANSAIRQTVHQDRRAIPVLGSYDVVVVGGGTGGAPAGIGAARRGAKTLVVEFLHGLGGVGTLGLIGKYYHGYRGGFTAEIDLGVAGMGGEEAKPSPGWNVEWKMEWLRRELRKAGADVWFGALGCGAYVEDGRVKGVVVATPHGRGVVLAEAVIDATGNADIAAAAGAECIYTDETTVAVQGTGMPPRLPGANYTNTDYTITDETDMLDCWRTLVVGRAKYRKSYDLASIIDTRERRRIVGDYVLSPLDIFAGRTFPDTVVMSKSNYDTHGYTIHPLFYVSPPDKKSVTAYTPYRCLLPRGLEGILVIGLGISAHRDSMPILRMQPDIQNQGYAVGVAAAMAAEADCALRRIDMKSLQKHLVEIECLPKSVLTDRDLFPLPNEEIAKAVKQFDQGYHGIAVVLSHWDEAQPLLRKAYASAGSETEKLTFAHVLGMMGDATGADTLVQAVRPAQWDAGWSFRGGGQFGASLSPLDSRIIALARTGDARAVDVVLDKLRNLGPDDAFSHHRSVAVALETLADPKAAKPLAEHLRKPGISAHAITSIESARMNVPSNPNLSRDLSLRELILARALYRCGDHEGTGERILRQYARDLRGHHARHASAVLQHGRR